MLNFPIITNPSSIEEEIYNPVLRSSTEDATVITRVKTTRMPMTFAIKWSLLKNTDYEMLKNFFKTTKGGTLQFTWIHPFSKKEYTVRFKTMEKGEFVQPCYWSTSATLEEV